MTEDLKTKILNRINSEYGLVPSTISDALSKAEEIAGRAIPAGKDRDEALFHIRAAAAANLLIGTDPGKELTAPGMLVWIVQQLTGTGAPEVPVEVPADHVLLPVTGHVVSLPRADEGMAAYYMRVAPSVGGNAALAASFNQWLSGEGAVSLVPTANQGSKDQWPLLVDAFIHGVTYKIAHNGGDTPGMQGPRIGTTFDWGNVIGQYEVTHWVNTEKHQVRSIQATADGVISSVHGSGAARVWATVGDAPATFPFSGNASAGAGASGRMQIKAGQWFSTCHENEGGGLMRCSMN